MEDIPDDQYEHAERVQGRYLRIRGGGLRLTGHMRDESEGTEQADLSASIPAPDRVIRREMQCLARLLGIRGRHGIQHPGGRGVIRLLDVGATSAEFARRSQVWGRARGVEIQVLVVPADGKVDCADVPTERVPLLELDRRWDPGSFDIVRTAGWIAALGRDLPRLTAAKMVQRLAREGVIWSDPWRAESVVERMTERAATLFGGRSDARGLTHRQIADTLARVGVLRGARVSVDARAGWFIAEIRKDAED